MLHNINNFLNIFQPLINLDNPNRLLHRKIFTTFT